MGWGVGGVGWGEWVGCGGMTFKIHVPEHFEFSDSTPTLKEGNNWLLCTTHLLNITETKSEYLLAATYD